MIPCWFSATLVPFDIQYPTKSKLHFGNFLATAFSNPNQRVHEFSKIQGSPHNFRPPWGDMKQVPHGTPTNIGRHHQKFSRHERPGFVHPCPKLRRLLTFHSSNPMSIFCCAGRSKQFVHVRKILLFKWAVGST
jgi:hypothetical protein